MRSVRQASISVWKNGYEIFPLWASTILAANFVGLDAELLNRASVLFIVSRILFNHFYINQKTQVAAALRSGLFFVSMLCSLFLGFKAGGTLALA